MNPSEKLSIFASGLFLLTGMLLGVWKYRWMMTPPDHRAPAYVDIAHRASLLYSFASLVIAKLVEYSPFGSGWQIVIVAFPLFYFAVTILVYSLYGRSERKETQFTERTLITTWGMYGLIAGEIGGVLLLLGGFVYTQMIR